MKQTNENKNSLAEYFTPKVGVAALIIFGLFSTLEKKFYRLGDVFCYLNMISKIR